MAHTITPTAKHEILLGKDPSSIQVQLYSAFPEFRGFSDRTLDPEILEAVVVLGLTYGTVKDRVLMLAPPGHEAWVLDQINQVADRMFEGCKKHPDAIQRIQNWTQLFKKLGVMGRLPQLKEEPQFWVSFGFSVDDALPAWMPGRLLGR